MTCGIDPDGISPEMISSLAEQASMTGLGNVRAEVADLDELSLTREART